MDIKIKLSPWQCLAFVPATAAGVYYIKASNSLAKIAGRDAWISIIISYVIGLILSFMLIYISKKYPGKNMFEYVQDLLGKPLGIIYSFIIILGNTIFLGIFIRCDFYCISSFFPRTPVNVLIIIILFILTYIVLSGIEVFARFLEVMFLPILVSIFLGIMLPIDRFSFVNLTPVLEYGFSPVIRAVPLLIGHLGNYLIFMSVWMPCINNPKYSVKITIIGLMVAFLIIIISFVISMGIYGVDQIKDIPFPMEAQVRLISLFGSFIRNLNWLLVPIWILAFIITSSAVYNISYIGIKVLSNSRKNIFISLIVAVGAFIFSKIPKNSMQNIDYYNYFYIYFYFPIVISIVLLFLITFIKKRGGQND